MGRELQKEKDLVVHPLPHNLHDNCAVPLTISIASSTAAANKAPILHCSICRLLLLATGGESVEGMKKAQL